MSQSCACGKRAFLSRKDAKAEVKRSEAQGSRFRAADGKSRMSAYRCSVGDMWHIGHAPAEFKEKQRMAR